jgi:hypothetical protein
LRPFDISLHHVRTAIVLPDRSDVLAPTGTNDELALFAKLVSPEGREPFTIVACCRRLRQRLVVEFAVKVPETASGGGELPPPLVLLQRLAEQVGFEVTIGGRTGRFIANERITVRSARLDEELRVNAAGRAALVQALAQLDRDAETGGFAVDCTMCFALDTAAYRLTVL